MSEKLKNAVSGRNDKKAKDLLFKFITLAVTVALILLFCNVLGQDRDGRKQIVDQDGGEEFLSVSSDLSTQEERRLEEILSLIRGVGKVDVMITCQEPERAVSVFSETSNEVSGKVLGVIAAAEGADSPVVRQAITDAVTSLFNIPASRVVVFQREDQADF